MIVRVKEYPEFLTSIYNYIIEEYELRPRDFEMMTNIKNEVDDIIETDGGKGLKYVEGVGVVRFKCYDYRHNRRALHTHKTIESNRHLLFCSEPEITALVYVNRSVYGRSKYRLIATMKCWLPTVTMNDVEVVFGGDNEVHSDLYPSYSIHFLRQNQTRFANLTYVYHTHPETERDDGIIDSNIVDDDDDDISERNIVDDYYTVTDKNKAIMVRRRSRSRSRSTSRGRSPSTTRRRSRSRSATVGVSTKRRRRSRSSSRRRSRSRSRSRSRTTR